MSRQGQKNRTSSKKSSHCGVLRREFFSSALGAVGSASFFFNESNSLSASERPRPRVAAIITSFTHRSHAHVILENFLEKYLFNGKKTDPGVDVVSIYADQRPQGDMSRQISKDYKIPIYSSIDKAVCLGGKQLAVDAVLSIAEHGNYPTNSLGQREYPRKRFFDEIVAVMKRSNRFVPIFNDKHFSYRWDWAEEMYAAAQKFQIPLMAGSSVPLAQRKPNLSLPSGAKIEQAVSIHGGPLESYDFHGLEVLQSIVESRQGGETGVASIEFLAGDALWNAANQGRWSIDLAKSAMYAELGKKTISLKHLEGEPQVEPHGLLVDYRDGTKAVVLRVGKSSTRWNFSCKLKGDPKPLATSFYVGPWNNRNLFKALSHAIQHHFIHRKSPYPVERTLLTTGMLEAAMRSRSENRSVTTPHLHLSYKPRDFTAMREMGASWKIITEDDPEPRGISPSG